MSKTCASFKPVSTTRQSCVATNAKSDSERRLEDMNEPGVVSRSLSFSSAEIRVVGLEERVASRHCVISSKDIVMREEVRGETLSL